MAKLRVVVIALTRAGGTLRYSHMMAGALGKRCNLRLILSKDRLEHYCISGEIDAIFVPTGTSRRKVLQNIFNPWHYRRLINAVCTFHPDVIWFPHEHFWRIPLACLLKQYHFVFTIHDVIRHLGEEASRLHLAKRACVLNEASRVIVLSRVGKQELAHQMDSEKIEVIPHGSFPFHIEGSSRILPPPPNNKTALFAGRIREYKGVRILLEAFRIVQGSIPDAKLVIAGSGDISAYQELIQGSKNLVIINHYLTEQELFDLYSQCDFVVAPYIDGSQSGVIPLALTNGRAVIATNVGGLPDQFTPGSSGLLVEPNDIHQLADAMETLFSNSKLAVDMGQQGSKEYATKFSWDTLARDMENTLACAAASPQKRSSAIRIAMRFANTYFFGKV